MRRVVMAAVLLAGCGPRTGSEGAGASGTSGTSGTTTNAGGSTGVAPWDPMTVCDPSFDLGLTPGAVAWTQQFAVGPGDRPAANAVALDDRGRVYAAGTFSYPDPNADVHGWLHALGADGHPRWEIRYQRDTLQQVFTDVAVAPSGDVIVVGSEVISVPANEWGEPDAIAIVLRYSPDGEMLWRTEAHGISLSTTRVAVGGDDDLGQEISRLDLGTPDGWSFASAAADPFGNVVLAGLASKLGLDGTFTVREYAR